MTKEPQEEIKEGVYYKEPHPNQNCCDKCHDVTFEKTYPAHTAYHACLNRKCECHKPQEETYQTLENKALEEFDKDYYRLEWHTPEEIKDFLKSHLQLAYKEGKESMREEAYEFERQRRKREKINCSNEGFNSGVTSERERIIKWAEKYMDKTTKYYGTDKHGIALDDLIQELQNK